MHSRAAVLAFAIKLQTGRLGSDHYRSDLAASGLIIAICHFVLWVRYCGRTLDLTHCILGVGGSLVSC